MRRLALASLIAGACVAPLPPCSDGVCDAPGGDDGSGSGTVASGSVGDSHDESTAAAGPVCGDGRLDEPEVCDDGNAIDGDGCNVDCDVSLRRLDFVTIDSGVQDRDIGLDIGVDDDGNIVVVGTMRALGSEHAFVGGFDPALAHRFDDVQLGGGATNSRAHAVAVNPAGFAAVAGDIEVNGAIDVMLRFYDPDGEMAWDTTFDGPDMLEDSAHAIVFDPFGQLYAAGRTNRMSGDGAALLLQYTPDGVLVGDTSIDAPMGGAIEPRALAHVEPSRLVLAGFELAANTSRIRVSAIDLEPFAAQTVHAGGGTPARASGVAVDGTGAIVVVGTSAGRGWAAKLGPSLTVVWVRDLAAPGDPHELFDLAIVPDDDSIYVVGDVDSPAGHNDVFAAHLDPDGDELSRAVHDLGGADDSARALVRAPDGTLLVTGETETVTGFDAFVLRLAP